MCIMGVLACPSNSPALHPLLPCNSWGKEGTVYVFLAAYCPVFFSLSAIYIYGSVLYDRRDLRVWFVTELSVVRQFTAFFVLAAPWAISAFSL